MSDQSPNPPEQIIDQMKQSKLRVPPPVFLEMNGEFVSTDPAQKTMTIAFPVEERFHNPMGTLQGGIIAAAIDNAIGPLSFTVAPPSVTKTLTINYLRPVKGNLEKIYVTAKLESQEGRQITFSATVHNEDGSVTYASAEALHIILKSKS